jgi:hypothetical protein
MGTAARTVIGLMGAVAVFLVLATTLFSGTGPAHPAPGPRACVAGPASPSADVRAERLLGAADQVSDAPCTAPVSSR